ncbi:MAG: iron-containing alcohol dehydrogenase [Deltaproteobacteria bacterium]|nr:iron-containing alcohol dehydrogenase [Deltaproteobacteria bacterium]
MAVSRMSFPCPIVFGPGSVQELPKELNRLGAKRPLLVADAGVTAAGLTRKVLDVLDKAQIRTAVWDACTPNPTDVDVDKGLAAYKKDGCDSIVAVGGGSPLDCAKLIRLMVNHPPPLSRYDDATGGDKYVTSNVPPMVAIPTTAGTGSEVGRSGVATLPDTGRKTVIFSPYLIAGAAIIDPELTLGLPPGPTAATGIDALTHCIEAYLSKGQHPLADAMALDGTRRVAKNLIRAVKDGKNDVEARQEMMAAAMMGAIAFQKGLGACHSLAHALTPIAGIHHGLANALCLPAVLEYNRETVPERLAAVAIALGEDPKLPTDALAKICVQRVRALIVESGIQMGLKNHGVTEAMLPQIADKAFEDACHTSSPRACTRDDLLNLAKASFT